MSRFATRRNARLLTVLGLLLALAGLAGFWLTRDIHRSPLSKEQRQLLGIKGNAFHVSFVVAGRDILYTKAKSDPIYGKGGKIVGWNYHGQVSDAGVNTDTILYVDITGDNMTMIAIPRDVFLFDLGYRINGLYAREGPDALRRRVSSILGVPVDYYAIIKLNIFQHLVDALGGVNVNVPYAMNYDDNVAGLHIHFKAGPQHMDGQQVAEFVRYRHTPRGDIDRLDNVKRLAYALMARLKQLNVRAVTKVPQLVDAFFSDVQTNASPTLVRQLASRIGSLQLKQTATIPTQEVQVAGEGTPLKVDPQDVNKFLAETFGGTPRTFSKAPQATLLITNQSGRPGLENWFRDRLEAMGVPAKDIMVRSLSGVDPTPSRLLATTATWNDADYYTSLLHTSKQQVDHLDGYDGRRVGLELILGRDATAMVPSGAHYASTASAR
ncbi:MAG TPA: LCP family protein [Trueperaceae bacterium]|nr:LCP family protein [Trueperaceae bacterium]